MTTRKRNTLFPNNQGLIPPTSHIQRSQSDPPEAIPVIRIPKIVPYDLYVNNVITPLSGYVSLFKENNSWVIGDESVINAIEDYIIENFVRGRKNNTTLNVGIRLDEFNEPASVTFTVNIHKGGRRTRTRTRAKRT